MAIRKHMLITLGLAGALSLPAFAQAPQLRQVAQHDQDDQNRNARGDDHRDNNAGYNNAGYNNQYYNSKAYKEGVKDGRKDHDKNRGERADRRHFKKDQDRQAYMAGYNDGYRGNGYNNSRRDQDDQRHDH